MNLRMIFMAMAMACLFPACAQQPTKGFEIFRELDLNTPPANIAVSQSGRIFMSTHQAYGSDDKMVELLEDGSYRRYPDADFNPELTGILGAIVDEKDILWMLNTNWDFPLGRVIGWDINKNELHKVVYITRPIFKPAYILNDMAVDRTNDMMYIADTSGGDTSALLVLDLNTGDVRRVLEGAVSTTAEDKQMIVDGKVLQMQGNEARVGVNPITIDVNNEWVYYAPMTSESIYRVRTADLIDVNLSSDELDAKVERYASKPMGDGITIDKAGNLYVSDLINNAIGLITTDREYRILHQDDDILSWVEGFANAGEKGMYATTNKLHKSAAFNNEDVKPDKFYIVQFEPLDFAEFGR